MAARHPSYSNPTLVEAVCVIYFVPDAAREWTPSKPLALYDSVKGEFPEMELVSDPKSDDDSDADRPEHDMQRLVLKNTEENRVLQVPASGNVLALNILEPYPGWAEVKATILRVWNATNEVLAPASIRQIGLRYINRVAHTEDAPTLASWLKPTGNIPSNFISSAPTSQLRLEIKKSPQFRSRYAVGHMAADEEDRFGSTVIDLDHYWESQTGDAADLSAVIEELHEQLWIEFSSALTDRYIEHLNNKIQGE